MNNFITEIDVALNAINVGVELHNSMKSSSPKKRYKISISNKKEEVTDMDIKINKKIASYIYTHFPNDIIVGEEYSLNMTDNNDEKKIWLIDPIDGTRSYINQINGYSIIIALVCNYTPTIGLIWDVRTNFVNVAIRGEGIYIFRNKQLKKITPLLTSSKKLIWNPYNPNMLKHRRLKYTLIEKLHLNGAIEVESCGLRAIELANKKGSIFLSLPNSAKIWDTAAGHVFINEIGGTYTDIEGKELIYSIDNLVHKNGAVASIDIRHKDVLTHLNSCLNSKRCYK